MPTILLGQIAGALALIQVIPYVVSILRGNTRPARSSYAIWLVVSLVETASYLSVGATTTRWSPIALTCTAILIFLLSLRYGMGGTSRLDVACLVIAGVAVVLWVATGDPVVALCASTVAWVIGYLPTIKKSWLLPGTENTFSWALYALSAMMNVLALTTLRPAIAVPPMLSLMFACAVTVLLIWPRRSSKQDQIRPNTKRLP